MINIPDRFIVEISNEEQLKVKEWWNTLSEENQSEIVNLFDEKKELCLIYSDAPARFNPRKLTKLEIIGTFEDKNLDSNEEWLEDFYEYLVAHPEARILVGQFENRTYHICTTHQKAREALKNGIIPFDFSCPFERDNCLMQKMLAQQSGKSLKLVAVFSSE